MDTRKSHEKPRSNVLGYFAQIKKIVVAQGTSKKHFPGSENMV